MKRALSLILALALAAALAVPACAAEFTDVPPGRPFYEDIMDCAAEGIASGYADGTFRPSAPVTKAQFCVMLARAFYSEYLEQYSTQTPGAWFMPCAALLDGQRVLAGTSFALTYSDPAVMDRPIERYDMAVLLSNMMALNGRGVSESGIRAAQQKIGDWSAVPAQYQRAVASCYALGVLNGQSDGTFGGSKSMNRAPACAVIRRLRERVTAPGPAPTESPAAAGAALANGEPVTEENALAVIDGLLKTYPDGTHWGLNTYRNGVASATMQAIQQEQIMVNGLTPSVQSGSGGFASLVSDTIFGSGRAAPARKVSPSETRPGDIIIIRDKNGYHKRYAAAASSAVWLGEGMYYAAAYQGCVNSKVSYADSFCLPEAYDETIGYYVEVWTRYPD